MKLQVAAAFVLLATTTAWAAIESPRVTSDRWPSGYSIGQADPGEELRVTIGWDDRSGAGRTAVKTLSGGRRDYVIRTDAERPDDITMRYPWLENRREQVEEMK